LFVFLSVAALLLLPGYLALLLAVPPTSLPDPMSQVALAVGLSGAILPLLLLFSSLAGLSLTPPIFAGLLTLIALAVLWRLWRLKWLPLAPWRSRSYWPPLGMFVGLLAVTLTLRILQVRDLVVPAWVDGVHHTLITQLIADLGRLPADYRPFLDIGPFIYHFGFHALAAALVWLTGLSVPQAVLVIGQVVNALVGVGVYGLTVSLLHRQGQTRGEATSGLGVKASEDRNPQSAIRNPQSAGLVAMGVVGVVSLMPAYYVTWGRYTQLTGLVVLPAAMMLTMRWVERGERWALVLGSVAVAGLGLVHYRVLVFYAAFVAALVLYRGVLGYQDAWSRYMPSALLDRRLLFKLTHLESRGVGRGPADSPPLRVAVLAGVSLLLLSPWIARIIYVLVTRGPWPGLEVDTQYTSVPYDLLLMPRNVPLAIIAAWGLTLGVWRRHRGVVLVGLWLLFLLAIAAVGSPAVPASAVVISLFLPEAVLTGYFVSQALDAEIVRRRRLVAGLGLVAIALWGAAGTRSIINPTTILLTQNDMAAVAWVRQHTPSDARFLINSRLWQGNIYVGTDAGYWLSVLAKRETMPPPSLYVLGMPSQVAQTNRVSEMTAAGRVDPESLRRAGLTHVFVGARGGPIEPARLLSDPAFALLYTDGRAWVFRLSAEPQVRRPDREMAPWP